MAIQVIQRGPGLGANLGRALGLGGAQGFTQGLQNAKQAQALSSILGISPQEALSYGGLDPQVLKEVIKGKRLKAEGDAFSEVLNAFEEYKAGGDISGNQFSDRQEAPPSLEEKIYPDKKTKAPSLAQMLNFITESKLNNLYQTAVPQENQFAVQQEASPEFGESIEKEIPRAQKEKSELQKFRDFIRQKKINLTPAQRKEAESQIMEQEKLAEDRKKNALAETRKYREKVNEEYETARDQLQDLERLDELNKGGKLDDAAWTTFLEESGLNIPALLDPNSQEFQKTALGFLRSGRSIFGSRLTDFDVKQLLQMIPTLSQSPQGRGRIIATLRRLARGKELNYKAMRDIMRENKGIPPDDLREQINDRIKGPLNDLYKKFKKEIAAMEQLLPEGSSKADIIGAALAGKVLQKAPSILGGAAKGALGGAALGSVVPAIGTGAGALGGGIYGALGGSLKDLL